MRTVYLACLIGLLAGATGLVVGQPADRSTRNRQSKVTDRTRQPDRSPAAVAVNAAGDITATANHTANAISFVDLKAGRVLCEHRAGNGPSDIAWVDSTTVLISLLHDDAVALVRFDRKTASAKTLATIAVGDEPRGLAVAPARDKSTSSATAYVALTGEDRVAVVDLKSRTVSRRIPVGGEPRTLAVSPNGRWLVTCCSVPGEVFVHDAATYRRLSKWSIFDEAFHLGRPVILPDSSAVVIPHPINRTFPIHSQNVEKGWAIDNRLTRLPLPGGKYWQQKQLGLDTRGRAAGDANAVAISPDRRWLAVACGGSHELLILDRRRFKWPVADPGDFIPVELRDKPGILRHVKLGGRPVCVRFVDDRRAVVANYLSNSLQVIDVVAGKLERTISLGGPKSPSLARRGEAMFYDADRSLDSWFSCHTCHTDGHTCGQTFDTVNDGNYDTYKLVPTLRGVTKTGPWTWHGWQKSLPAALKKSFRTTLSSQRKTTDEDVRALLAYFKSLEHPRSPFRTSKGKLTAPAKRGRSLFRGKAGCATCHAGDNFTSAETYKVGLESSRYFFRSFNPPSLRGLHARRRFLHDGRAATLKEVLTRHHRPEKLAGEKLSERELRDLIAYLKSL